MINNAFTICSLFYSLMLVRIYFKRKNFKSLETTIYSKMIVINILNVVMALVCAFTIINKDSFPLINDLISKALLVLFASWVLLFTGYIIAITVKSKTNLQEILNRRKIMISFLLMLLVAIIYVLPLYYHNENNVVYSYGPSANVVYGLTGILVFAWVIIIFTHRELLKSKKIIPVGLFVVLAIVSVTIQKMNPGLLLITATETFITFLMYFTIENPDVKMLNELYKNRELMEQGYEDKYNFLFEMTQDAKKPLLDLNRVSNELRQEEDPKKIKDGLMAINNLTRQLDFAINDVLNVSSFDIQKLKIVNTKYDVLKVCDGLNTTMKGEIKKGVTFNMDLPKSVPTLYGDYMKLRQILYSLLNNASKNTDEGSINLRLNIIEKYDFCRLIFNISDTGKGMSIEKINDILSSTGELDKNELELLEKKEFNFKVCQKVVKIMGGNIMIKSTVGMGTEITLTMDQRVYHEKETSILNQYENVINTSKKVLIVAQDKDLSNYIKRKLNNNDISYSSLAFGGDAVDRIKAGKEYDYMLVEDDMKEMSGLATLQELQKLKDFDIPVIVMLNESKDSIKDHYIKDGFDDYLLTNNLEEEVKRIIEKY